MKNGCLIIALLLSSYVAQAQFPAPYCAEVFQNVENITNVTFGTISNPSPVSGGPAHQDFTGISTVVYPGVTYNLEVQGNTSLFIARINAFIDFNNNGNFADPGEVFIVGAFSSTGTDGKTVGCAIPIPATAAIGNIRMRISKLFNNIPAPCNPTGSGQAEDYTLTVTPLPCALPSNLTFSNITIPNATIAWSGQVGVSSYEYAITTSPTSPVSGTVTTATSATAGGFPANTALYAHIRSICNGGFTTPWISRANVPNDSCGAPILLTPGTSINTGNTGATPSLPAAMCLGFPSSSPVFDVWYAFTPAVTGNATVSVTNPSALMNAVIVSYSGSCGSLTAIDCRNQPGPGSPSTLNLTGLIAGQTYRIRVYGYSGSQGTFSLTLSGITIPVTGVTLSGVRSNSKAQLSWQTLTEINNAGFELQRSADGRNFTGIAQIASKANGGNSTAAVTYSAEDAKPFSGANYYRLKQTDKDGKISYSNIFYLKGDAVSHLTLGALYPNPSKTVLKVAIQAPLAESITFLVTDMMGKTISRQTALAISGDNTINIDVVNLPSGSYLLKAISSNGSETAYQKFTRQ